MSTPATTTKATVGVSLCRSCQTEIYWLASEKTGKFAPISAKPVDGGNIRVDLVAGTYSIVPKADRRGPLRQNHFSDCRQADRWHKEKKEEARS